MFDVTLSETEQYHESDGYRPGDQAVIAETSFGKIGMTICYDIRFPHLYLGLAKSGASILLIPAAFALPTGRAHWEVLLRARAIETGCFVIAAAQTAATRFGIWISVGSLALKLPNRSGYRSGGNVSRSRWQTFPH